MLAFQQGQIFLPSVQLNSIGVHHLPPAWVPNMFCNFYLVENHKSANNSTTTEDKEKINTDLDP
jgi:hypothetical protein